MLDSLTPVEPDPAAPGRVLFEPEDVEQQLDQLMGDIAALRERVQHLVGLVPDDVVLPVASDSACAESTTKHTKKTKKNKKQKKKAEGTKEHRAARRGA